MDWNAVGLAVAGILTGLAAGAVLIRKLLIHLAEVAAEVRRIRNTVNQVKSTTNETKTATAEVKAQVKNSHTSNLRDDVDRLADRLERQGDRADEQHREVLGHLLTQAEQMKDVSRQFHRHVEHAQPALDYYRLQQLESADRHRKDSTA